MGRLRERGHKIKKSHIPLSVQRTETGPRQEGSEPGETRKADIYKEPRMIRGTYKPIDRIRAGRIIYGTI